MESSDKMFVVILVMAIIFTGVFVYLLLLDRQTHRLSKEVEKLEAERKARVQTKS
ncbi:MAG TPA: hypothetical protein DEO70_07700 [Bacteroidales bacterium]|nr:MAG: hypothetical protein CVU06_00950 [Bacteroidetes bacterium HGW-Bacteroidetes-22]HBZ66706.1 hypothetical protein [Bacteroidales bacterium]